MLGASRSWRSLISTCALLVQLLKRIPVPDTQPWGYLAKRLLFARSCSFLWSQRNYKWIQQRRKVERDWSRKILLQRHTSHQMLWWFWCLLGSEEMGLYLLHRFFYGGAFCPNDSRCSEQTVAREWSGDASMGKPAAKVCTAFSERMDGWMCLYYQASNQTVNKKQLYRRNHLQEKRRHGRKNCSEISCYMHDHSSEPLCCADMTFPSIQKWFTREEKNPFLVKYLDSKQPIFTALRLRKKMLCFWSRNPKGTINSGQSKDKRLYKSCVHVSVMAESTTNQSFYTSLEPSRDGA